MKDLGGKVAVVTGGGGGIGKVLGERFAREGMKVVLADVIEEPLKAAVDEVRAQSPDVIGVACDVTSYESVEALRDATLDAFGAVHLVCNNAGVGSGSEGQLWEHHLQDWRWSFDVNVYGVIHGINAFVPVMLEQDTEGHVVNTSSGNGGFSPLINSAVYATTKAAVVTITECLWGQLREIGAKVSASVLFPSTRTPGMLNTGIWQPGKNRPARYARPGASPEGRDALAEYKQRMEAAGQEVVFAPLEEVAEICLEGILADTFWITAASDRQADTLRARVASQIDQTPPDYLLAGSLMTQRPSERARQSSG
jgi:NAD(P)-dependent dehydrogenase (short-subunit alcohol dehydrogenase family)